MAKAPVDNSTESNPQVQINALSEKMTKMGDEFDAKLTGAMKLIESQEKIINAMKGVIDELKKENKIGEPKEGDHVELDLSEAVEFGEWTKNVLFKYYSHERPRKRGEGGVINKPN